MVDALWEVEWVAAWSEAVCPQPPDIITPTIEPLQTRDDTEESPEDAPPEPH